MEKKGVVIIAEVKETPVDLDELCEICQVSFGLVKQLVEYEIIHPLSHGRRSSAVPREEAGSSNQWLFDLRQLKRLQMALRLQHDLEMNLASIAVVLDLLDEMDSMRRQLDFLKKHFRNL